MGPLDTNEWQNWLNGYFKKKRLLDYNNIGGLNDDELTEAEDYWRQQRYGAPSLSPQEARDALDSEENIPVPSGEDSEPMNGEPNFEDDAGIEFINPNLMDAHRAMLIATPLMMYNMKKGYRY